jgi:uncharacterized protein YbaP (TraB family)
MTKHHHSNQAQWIARLLISILVLVLPGVANSQVVGNGYNNSMIYKIRGETNTVYILGSLHALAEEYYPLTRAFSYAYYDSQKLVFEVAPEILFSKTNQLARDKFSTFQNGMTLRKALSPKTYRRLEKHLRQMGINIKDIQNYKPWKAYLIASSGLDSSKDFRPDLGIEMYFYQRAKDAGKPIGGLETPKDQWDAFDNLTFKEQEALIIEALKDRTKLEKEFVQLVKSWHQGDLQGMAKHVETYKTFPKYYHGILVRRNHNWVPKIEKFLKDTKNYFVIVGVAHLAGEDGLLALLKEKGYELERVSYVMP